MDAAGDSRQTVVTIIVPCYNYAKYLPRLITALQQQSFNEWECIVVNDGSTDNTTHVVSAFATEDNRIKLISQENSGQAAARNTGIDRASGEFVQFIDADDVIEPMKLSRQVEWMRRHDDTDIVYGDVRYFSDSAPDTLFVSRWGVSESEWMPKISGKGQPVVRAFVDQNIFELGSALFRREAIERIGAFDPILTGVEDYDYCFRGAWQWLSFAYLPWQGDDRILMRHHETSFSKNMIVMYQRELLLRKKMHALFSEAKMIDLILLNKARCKARYKRMQDKLVDQTMRDRKRPLPVREIKWAVAYGAAMEKCRFMLRISKAIIFRAFRRAAH